MQELNNNKHLKNRKLKGKSLTFQIGNEILK